MNLLLRRSLLCKSVLVFELAHAPKRSLTSGQLKKYFNVLNVNRNSSKKDIRDSFLKLSKVHHPDNKATGSHAKFVELKEAYDALKDGTPDTTRSTSSPDGRSPYYEDYDFSYQAHRKYRDRYKDYQTAYEASYSSSANRFGGRYANSQTPWEDFKRHREYNQQASTHGGAFTRVSARPILSATLILSAIAWIVIYSSILLMWDYNDSIRKNLARHKLRDHLDYEAYEKYLQARETAKLLNVERARERQRRKMAAREQMLQQQQQQQQQPQQQQQQQQQQKQQQQVVAVGEKPRAGIDTVIEASPSPCV